MSNPIHREMTKILLHSVEKRSTVHAYKRTPYSYTRHDIQTYQDRENYPDDHLNQLKRFPISFPVRSERFSSSIEEHDKNQVKQYDLLLKIQRNHYRKVKFC